MLKLWTHNILKFDHFIFLFQCYRMIYCDVFRTLHTYVQLNYIDNFWFFIKWCTRKWLIQSDGSHTNLSVVGWQSVKVFPCIHKCKKNVVLLFKQLYYFIMSATAKWQKKIKFNQKNILWIPYNLNINLMLAESIRRWVYSNECMY